MRPQVYIRAIEQPTAGQMVTIASNNSGQSIIQKLDSTSWSWSFPTSSTFHPFFDPELGQMHNLDSY